MAGQSLVDYFGTIYTLPLQRLAVLEPGQLPNGHSDNMILTVLPQQGRPATVPLPWQSLVRQRFRITGARIIEAEMQAPGRVSHRIVSKTETPVIKITPPGANGMKAPAQKRHLASDFIGFAIKRHGLGVRERMFQGQQGQIHIRQEIVGGLGIVRMDPGGVDPHRLSGDFHTIGPARLQGIKQRCVIKAMRRGDGPARIDQRRHTDLPLPALLQIEYRRILAFTREMPIVSSIMTHDDGICAAHEQQHNHDREQFEMKGSHKHPENREYEQSGLYPKKGKPFRVVALLGVLAVVILLMMGAAALIDLLIDY